MDFVKSILKDLLKSDKRIVWIVAKLHNLLSFEQIFKIYLYSANA